MDTEIKTKTLQDKFLQYGIPEKYQFRNMAGLGGMKSVAICYDAETKREVAVAVTLKTDGNNRRNFLAEARLTARLEHPNIIPVHEIGATEDGKPFFVMKLASGRSLARILRNLRELDPEYSMKYTIPVLLDIFLKVCSAIEFAHSHGICHLDLKPDNIQVGNFGEVLVLDWGLARRVEEIRNEKTPDFAATQTVNIEKTLNGIVKGTPEYMAPEQALGINTSRGPLSDVYSLGAILYAMLTFHAPVGGESSDEIINNAAQGRLLPPRRQETGGREIPQVLQFVAFKAMNRAPSQRYQSVGDLRKDVEAYLKGYPTVAENAGSYTKLVLFFKRRRLQLFLAVSLFFICFILIAFLAAKLYYKNVEISFYEQEAVQPNFR